MTSRTPRPSDIKPKHGDKLLFSQAGITKSELVDYYARIAERMLPHLRDRPIAMHRFPNGIDQPGFFQKDMPAYFPDWIEHVRIASKQGGRKLTYVLCQDERSLIYLAEQACITPHVWLSRVDRLDHPDLLIFDLDPPTAADFKLVRRAARGIRQILDELGLVSGLMSTGSRGLHVRVTLDRQLDFEGVRDFARAVAEVAVARDPAHLTLEHHKDKRQGRLYLDIMRNAYAQLAVPPYAVRARPQASVAVPLPWEALRNPRLRADRYTVRNLFRHLQAQDYPWVELDAQPQNLQAAWPQLKSLLIDLHAS
jgi:bifunctional non-homologous end joining protein LigD